MQNDGANLSIFGGGGSNGSDEVESHLAYIESLVEGNQAK